MSIKKRYCYKTTKLIIKDMNIKTKQNYYEIAKIDERLPKNPECASTFRGEFKGWIDYLSITGDFYDLKTAKIKANEMIKAYNLNRHKEYIACHFISDLDKKFPPYDLWREYYNIPNLQIFFKLKKYKLNVIRP